MATYKRFEDLPVWQAAIQLAEAVYALTEDGAFKGRYSLRDQIERAAVSVSNNVADEARQRGDGQRRRRWPGATRRASRAGCPRGGSARIGFERGTTNELLSFIYIARGSAGEVRSMLCLLERLEPFGHLKAQISDIKPLAESCSRQLRAWADSLQNSDIEGPRRLNDRTRREYTRRTAATNGVEAFQEMAAQHLPRDHPLHPDNQR